MKCEKQPPLCLYHLWGGLMALTLLLVRPGGRFEWLKPDQESESNGDGQLTMRKRVNMQKLHNMEAVRGFG